MMSKRGDLTELVVRTALEVSVEDLSLVTLDTIKLAILDLICCCVAGSEADSAKLVSDWAQETSGRTDSVIIGTGLRASPPLAALANGTAAHALDFDDVSMRMIHPSATLVPALLAIGESCHIPGEQFLAGYIAGFEVQARLCRVLNPEHYERGWHSTGTVGALGSAIASCRALGLDVEATRNALGIAASSASSIRKNFGSMVKPLHAGQAAFHGLQAAELARKRFTADRSVLEGANGFLEVFSSLELAGELYQAFEPGAPYEVAESGIALKRFACCGAIHSAQDALLDLLESDPFAPEEVVRIDCRVNRLIPKILVHNVTRSGLEGKFSMQYSLAVCLLDRRAGLSQYAESRAADPALVPIMERVNVVVDDSIPVNLAYFPSVVTVSLRDGRELTSRVDIPKGYPERPLSEAEVVDKARDCCAGVLEGGQFDDLVTTVLHLEKLPDVAMLAALLARA